MDLLGFSVKMAETIPKCILGIFYRSESQQESPHGQWSHCPRTICSSTTPLQIWKLRGARKSAHLFKNLAWPVCCLSATHYHTQNGRARFYWKTTDKPSWDSTPYLIYTSLHIHDQFLRIVLLFYKIFLYNSLMIKWVDHASAIF